MPIRTLIAAVSVTLLAAWICINVLLYHNFLKEHKPFSFDSNLSPPITLTDPSKEETYCIADNMMWKSSLSHLCKREEEPHFHLWPF